jgi:outer membrane protein with beta-barrel domain
MSIMRFVWLLPAALFCQSAQSQVFDGARISLRAGADYSYITGLETTILSEPYFTDYSLKGKHIFGFTGGIGFNGEIKNSIVSMDLDIMYAQQGSELLFNNTAQNWNYQMQFKYQFINIPLLFRLYPFNRHHDGLHGFNLGAGAQLGLNIASNDLLYTSGGPGRLPAFGTDLAEQQQLRNVIKGKNQAGLLFNIGYDIPNIGLDIDFRYHAGLSDVVETQTNAYNFIENKNVNNTLQLTIGWEFFSTYPKKHMILIRPPGS